MMTWRELLQRPADLVYPWTGGRELRVSGGRRWLIDGQLPPEHGWWAFATDNRRRAIFIGGPASTTTSRVQPCFEVTGWLAGDRLVSESSSTARSALELIRLAERVRLIPSGMERFQRVRAGRFFEQGPLSFLSLEMPLGPEGPVLDAFLDRLASVEHVPAVTPGLAAAFRLETWRRDEQARARAAAERRRREREAQLEREARRRQVVEQLADGIGRRAMARVDFATAARAALAVGGAQYLDHRGSVAANEMVVRFRLNGQRFECTCDAHTLQIIDSGICLKQEGDGSEFDAGTRGDTWFTLESLPGVIQQAEREDKLVVFRHA